MLYHLEQINCFLKLKFLPIQTIFLNTFSCSLLNFVKRTTITHFFHTNVQRYCKLPIFFICYEASHYSTNSTRFSCLTGFFAFVDVDRLLLVLAKLEKWYICHDFGFSNHKLYSMTV